MQLSLVLLSLLPVLSVSALPTPTSLNTRDVASVNFSSTELNVVESSKRHLVAHTPREMTENERLRAFQDMTDHWTTVVAKMRDAMWHPFFSETTVAPQLRRASARFSKTLRDIMQRRGIPIPPHSSFETETSAWDMLNAVIRQPMGALRDGDRAEISRQVNMIEPLAREAWQQDMDILA
ncbi:hypothetical protein FRB99_003455, partial [Tulasnella sp. 403]